MLRINLWLIFLAGASSLFQFSVFSFWQLNRFSPQVWLAAVFFLFLKRPKYWAELFLLFYFLFYDLVSPSARPPFVVSLAFILATVFFRRALSGRLEKRILAPLVFFLILNSFYLLILVRDYNPLSLFPAVLLNFLFFLILYPLFSLLSLVLRTGNDSQLNLKL